jgi:hypothetical protein
MKIEKSRILKLFEEVTWKCFNLSLAFDANIYVDIEILIKGLRSNQVLKKKGLGRKHYFTFFNDLKSSRHNACGVTGREIESSQGLGW